MIIELIAYPLSKSQIMSTSCHKVEMAFITLFLPVFVAVSRYLETIMIVE